MWKKVKHWYWWHFKATEDEKVKWDMACYGTGIMKGGKRVIPKVLTTNK